LEWDLESHSQTNETVITTLGKTLSVEPNGEEEPILMLGCGNSKFDEDMIQDGWTGLIIRVDVSSRIIESMSQQWTHDLH
jgi:hypothetical protein